MPLKFLSEHLNGRPTSRLGLPITERGLGLLIDYTRETIRRNELAPGVDHGAKERRMLRDDYLPEFDVRTSYATRIAASPAKVYASLWTANFDQLGDNASTLRSTYAPNVSSATA